jgi:uncharacterized membrane protein
MRRAASWFYLAVASMSLATMAWQPAEADVLAVQASAAAFADWADARLPPADLPMP